MRGFGAAATTGRAAACCCRAHYRSRCVCPSVCLPAEIPADPYIESTGYWQDICVDQSDDDVWKTTDMGWGVYPEGLRKMLNYIQVRRQLQLF